MKYDKDFKPMAWRTCHRHTFYNEAIKHSLHFLSEAFLIEDLADNKKPADGKEYITVDEDVDMMVIQSLFKKNGDYIIPRLSVVNLNDKLGAVYEEEITYLKDTFDRIGECYKTAEFSGFNIAYDVYDGLFSITVDAEDSFSKRPVFRKYKTTLGMLAEVDHISDVAHEIFNKIRNELVEYINKNRAKLMLNDIYGMTGGDFDGDVLYKEYLDKQVEELRTSLYRELGVPESVINSKECTAEYEHIMAAIRATSGNYKGGYMRDYTSMYGKAIKKVIFNDPATVVMWNDGTKTVVKKHGDVEFNGEAAVMYAYVLRWHFNNNRKSMRIWLKQNAKRFEWQSEEPKKITVTRTSKGKITKASQKEIYEAMTPEQKEVVDAMIQDAVKESKKTNKVTKKASDGGKNEDAK